MQRFFKLERVTRRAPLGMRFLDLARGLIVNDGLVVTAWRIGTSGPKQRAYPSPLSGIYGFRTLLGLHGFEVGERPASDWCSSSSETTPPDEITDLTSLRGLLSADENPTQANFVVSVQDSKQRFLPQVLQFCLPKEHLVEVPLFSSPARPALAGQGIVRGELVTSHQGQPSEPASWALVTATIDNHTSVAVADARGMFTLFVPYASVLPPLDGAPPKGNGTGQLSWPITLQVFYQPSKQRSIAEVGLPDSLSILDQDRANVYLDMNTAPVSELTAIIRLGGDLVVATAGQSQLFVAS